MLNTIYFLLGFIAYSFSLQSSSWAHETVGLPKHPDYRYAKLDNGFGYAWHSSANKNNSCQVRLHVDVGSLQEQEHEAGMAHFLEHMAFKRNKHVSADLIKYMQSLGLQFGAHSNAHTSGQETVYKFDLYSKCDAEHLEKILLAVRGIADGLVFDEEDIRTEKGVVDAEERQPTPGFNMGEIFEKIMSELKANNPMGTKTTRDKFDSKMLQGFYEKWYVPQGMKLIVVGDMEGMDLFMGEKIPKIFDTMRRNAPYWPRKNLTPSHLVSSHAVLSLPLPMVGLFNGRFNINPIAPRNLSTMITHQKLLMLANMLKKRLTTTGENNGTGLVIYNQDMTVGDAIQGQESRIPLQGIYIASNSSKSTFMNDMATIEMIIEKTIADGFFATELQRGLEWITAQSLKSPSTNPEIIYALLNDARGFLAPLTKDQVQQLIIPELNKMTLVDAQNMLKQLWQRTPLRAYIGDVPKMSPEELDQQFKQACQSITLPAFEAPQELSYALSAQTTAARVRDMEHTGDKVVKVVFENGVTLGVVTQQERALGNFQITIKPKNLKKGPLSRREHVVADLYLRNHHKWLGMKEHSPNELKTIFQEAYQKNSIIWLRDDGFGLTSLGQSDLPRDVLKQCELLYGYFNNPKLYEPEFESAQKSDVIKLTMLAAPNFQGFQQQVFGPDKDTNFVEVTAAEIATIGSSEVMDMLTPFFSNDELEITFFGAEPIDDVVDAVGKTFGSLKKRRAQKTADKSTGDNKKPFMQSKIVSTIKAPHLKQAQLKMYYPLAHVTQIKDKQCTEEALRMLKTIAISRMTKITRIDSGAGYTNSGYMNFDGEQAIAFEFLADLEPTQAEGLSIQIINNLHALAITGPSGEEFDLALAQSNNEKAKDVSINDLKILASEVLAKDLVSYAIASPLY